jgi:hypothetical protein
MLRHKPKRASTCPESGSRLVFWPLKFSMNIGDLYKELQPSIDCKPRFGVFTMRSVFIVVFEPPRFGGITIQIATAGESFEENFT